MVSRVFESEHPFQFRNILPLSLALVFQLQPTRDVVCMFPHDLRVSGRGDEPFHAAGSC